MRPPKPARDLLLHPADVDLLAGDNQVATLIERLGRALWGTERFVCCDPSSPALCIVVKCSRCGELIRTRVEKAYELEAEYEATNGHTYAEGEEPKPSGYTLQKELVGARCQNLIHLSMHFDAHRGANTRSIQGGEFVEVTDCE